MLMTWADRLFSASLAHQSSLGHGASLGEIYNAGIPLAQGGHQRAHVFHAGGTEFRYDGIDGGGDLVIVQLFGQEALNDADFIALLLGEFEATAFLVHPDRFLALLDHFLQELENIAVIDPLGDPVDADRDIPVLNRSHNQTQGRDRALILGTHGIFELLGNQRSQHRAHLLGCWGGWAAFGGGRRLKASIGQRLSISFSWQVQMRLS
jgi:hypothetical protein